MTVTSLGWLGVRTERIEETAAFYRDVLGLECLVDRPDDARFRLADGTEVHVYGPGDEDHAFFGTGPVVGLVVDNFGDARARMVAAGIAFVGPVQEDEAMTWNHFVGPDGNVYELIGRRRPGSASLIVRS
jgi:catechol 2,3-dioxygenase-like lactoylglutathione lyase family enzyme